jgi:hypothetical protein
MPFRSRQNLQGVLYQEGEGSCCLTTEIASAPFSERRVVRIPLFDGRLLKVFAQGLHESYNTTECS